MTLRITFAVAARVLAQLRRDHRTVAMLIVLPTLLVTLMWWMFHDSPAVFDRIGGPLLAVFPSIIMFVVTSVATLRERSTGTLPSKPRSTAVTCAARWCCARGTTVRRSGGSAWPCSARRPTLTT